ncbi:hypothetical protein ACWGJP_08385 [Microbacterium sp. NPDC055903]
MIEGRGAGRRLRDATAPLRRAFGRRAVPVWIAVAVAASASGAVVALGGLDESVSRPADMALGEEIRLPTHAVTVLDATFADAVEEEFLEAEPGEALLVVTLRLENLTDRPIGLDTTSDRISSRLVNAAEPLLALSGAEPVASASTWLTDGSAGSVVLQPEVPAEVTIAWPVSEADAVEGIALDVHEARIRSGQIILGSDVITWEQAALVARVDLGSLGGLG